MHVGYNPWTGWNYGLSWSNGFLTIGFNFRQGGNYHHGGWYGGGYHRPIVIDDRDINIGNINIGNNINVGNKEEIVSKLKDRQKIQQNNFSKENIYQRAESASRNVDREKLRLNLENSGFSQERANDLFADREGNVVRRQNDSWQTRGKNQWKNNSSYGRENTRSSRDSVDRAYDARERGAVRERSSVSRGGRAMRR